MQICEFTNSYVPYEYISMEDFKKFLNGRYHEYRADEIKCIDYNKGTIQIRFVRIFCSNWEKVFIGATINVKCTQKQRNEIKSLCRKY